MTEGLPGPPRARVVYADLDGTLLGPGGSLFARTGGSIGLHAAEAVAALHRAGIPLVPVSGRTLEQSRETARLLGAPDFIAELGGLACYGGGEEILRDYGAFEGTGTPYEAMAGAAGMLFESFAGRLEPHAPWAFEGRECTMLLRGRVDVREVRRTLVASGYGWLDLVDNGTMRRDFPGPEADPAHVYHLVPLGVGKDRAVAADLMRRGLPSHAAVAVGDAPSDAGLAPHVGAVMIVANGRESVEAHGPLPENVFITRGSHGEGFAEAVEALLA